MSIADWQISDTGFAVIDVETTGCSPGTDRIIEVGVVHLCGDENPSVVFETVLNPSRRVGNREVHGITNRDTRNAPSFREVAGDVFDALADRVIVAHNAYFDLGFLFHEMELVDGPTRVPFLCTMNLAPLLGVGPREKLQAACLRSGIREGEAAHRAVFDALRAASLFSRYLREINNRGISTFGELASLGSHKFLSSIQTSPWRPGDAPNLGRAGRVKKRQPSNQPPAFPPGETSNSSRQSYSQKVVAVVDSLVMSETERQQLKSQRIEEGLAPEAIRGIHASVFADILNNCVSNAWIDDADRLRLARAYQLLKTLGWAPGEKEDRTCQS